MNQSQRVLPGSDVIDVDYLSSRFLLAVNKDFLQILPFQYSSQSDDGGGIWRVPLAGWYSMLHAITCLPEMMDFGFAQTVYRQMLT